jgi:hypothetical protein
MISLSLSLPLSLWHRRITVCRVVCFVRSVDDVPELQTTVTVQIDDEESTVRFVDKSTGGTLDVSHRTMN